MVAKGLDLPDLSLHIINSRPTIPRPSAEIELYWESIHVVLARHMRFAADISVSGQLIVLPEMTGLATSVDHR
jgi:hypothetical protein